MGPHTGHATRPHDVIYSRRTKIKRTCQFIRNSPTTIYADVLADNVRFISTELAFLLNWSAGDRGPATLFSIYESSDQSSEGNIDEDATNHNIATLKTEPFYLKTHGPIFGQLNHQCYLHWDLNHMLDDRYT